jgi:hypothetical protein
MGAFPMKALVELSAKDFLFLPLEAMAPASNPITSSTSSMMINIHLQSSISLSFLPWNKQHNKKEDLRPSCDENEKKKNHLNFYRDVGLTVTGGVIRSRIPGAHGTLLSQVVPDVMCGL